MENSCKWENEFSFYRAGSCKFTESVRYQDTFRLIHVMYVVVVAVLPPTKSERMHFLLQFAAAGYMFIMQC